MYWQKLPHGILFKNATSINPMKDIIELGYNPYEIYPIYSVQTNSIVVGYFKLLTNELVAIHREDEIIMDEHKTEKYLSDVSIIMDWEEEDILEKGIKNKGISQKYIESIYKQKARNNRLSNDKYEFLFKDGYLTSFKSTMCFTADARDFLNVDKYVQEAEKWYRGDKKRIIEEVNLQAACFLEINFDILLSPNLLKNFLYPNGCYNYIAIAAYYKSCEVEFEAVLNSTHGNYELIENKPEIKIKAYDVIYSGTSRELDDSDLKQVSVNDTFGYVYIMINPSLPYLVKIGKTSRDPNERAKELSAATGVPTPFIVIYQKPFRNCSWAENMIHNYFKDKGLRINDNREFFQTTPMEAIEILNTFYRKEQEE